MHSDIHALRVGDIIRFVPHGKDLKITAKDPYLAVPELVLVTFQELADPIPLSPETRLIVTHAPRTYRLPCLLCKQDFGVELDLSIDGTPRTGLCGPCNHRTGVAVFGPAH
jgi:hypothetical protein